MEVPRRRTASTERVSVNAVITRRTSPRVTHPARVDATLNFAKKPWVVDLAQVLQHPKPMLRARPLRPTARTRLSCWDAVATWDPPR